MIDYSDIKIHDFVINKMPLSTYNYLEKNNMLSVGQLYFIDDLSSFDMKDMEVINVAEPDNVKSAVNVNYANKTYVQNKTLSTEIKKMFIYKSKIIDENITQCISTDCNIYSLKNGEADWSIESVIGPYDAKNVSVYYSEAYTTKGWHFLANGTYDVRTTETDKNAKFLEGCSDDGTVGFRGYRDCWTKKDSLIKKSEINSCLSDITDESQLTDVIAALKKLREL